MKVKVYERILDLLEAEGIRAIFGIPDPNFVHLFHLADERGWSVVSPHHEASAGFMAEAASRMTGRPPVAIGTLGPGIANLAPAIMCARVENSPVIFLGGQRARITEQRVRRGRIQFVQQAPLVENSVKYSASIEYADQTDEVIRHALRTALSGTPGPAYIEYPSHVILEDLEVEEALPPSGYRLVGQQAGASSVARAVAAIEAASKPILLVGHGVHTARAGASVRELAELLAAPVIQTSGGTSYIEGLEDRTFPYGFSPAAIDAVVTCDLCLAIGTEIGEPVHYGKWRHWAPNAASRTWVVVEQDPAATGVNRPVGFPGSGACNRADRTGNRVTIISSTRAYSRPSHTGACASCSRIGPSTSSCITTMCSTISAIDHRSSAGLKFHCADDNPAVARSTASPVSFT